MSFLGLPQLSPAKSTKNELYKLVNRITSQLSTFVDWSPVSVSLSTLVDLATTDIVEVVPPRPGFFFIATGAWFASKTTTGVAVAPPTLGVGNNPTATNVVAAGASPGIAIHAAGAPSGSALTVVAPLLLVDMATPILAAVTVAATGGVGFAWTGRVHVTGYYFVQ